jgi:hypothetical protein
MQKEAKETKKPKVQKGPKVQALPKGTIVKGNLKSVQVDRYSVSIHYAVCDGTLAQCNELKCKDLEHAQYCSRCICLSFKGVGGKTACLDAALVALKERATRAVESDED